MSKKKTTRYVGKKEGKVLQIEPNTIDMEYSESAHMCLIDHQISQPSLDISRICVHYHSRSQKTTDPSSVECV
jgi:hypothetical protein